MTTITDLELAREWLDSNEGLDGEREACQRVARFLGREIQRRINDSAVRRAARACGVPLSVARAALAKAKRN